MRNLQFSLLMVSISLIQVPLSAQLNYKDMPAKTNIEKWSHAIINLEVRKTSQQNEDEALRKYRNKEIDFDKYIQSVEDVRTHTGTAIFLKHNDHHYLLTARHVLENLDADEKLNIIARKIMLIENGSAMDADGKYKVKFGSEMLMNLGSGPQGARPYVFSQKVDDLAAICLDHRFHNKEFINTLYQKGYIPITMADIDSSQLKEGQELTSFGFPGDISTIDKRDLRPAEKNFHSDIVSLPVISRGAVNDPLLSERFFSGGIYVSPGSSGGPIVSRNKLVGIVSRQEAVLQTVNTPSLNYYINRDLFFIKSSLLVDLVIEMEKKVRWVENTSKDSGFQSK